MNWCNCNHDNFYRLSTCINEDSLTCWSCNNRITNEDLISLLLKELKQIGDKTEVLEVKRANVPDIDYMCEKAQEIKEYFKEKIHSVDVYKEKEKEIEEARREAIESKKESTVLRGYMKDLESRVINLEFRNKQLIKSVTVLELEEQEKQNKRIRELEKDLENMNKQTERFEMMDL